MTEKTTKPKKTKVLKNKRQIGHMPPYIPPLIVRIWLGLRSPSLPLLIDLAADDAPNLLYFLDKMISMKKMKRVQKTSNGSSR